VIVIRKPAAFQFYDNFGKCNPVLKIWPLSISAHFNDEFVAILYTAF